MADSRYLELVFRGFGRPLDNGERALALLDRPARSFAARFCRSDHPVLSLCIDRRDVDALSQELGSEDSLTTRTLHLLDRVVAALGGRLTGVYLVACTPDIVRTSIEVETAGERVDLSVEPALALAAAVRLGLPVLADRVLVEPDELARKPFTGPLAAFLDQLDLTGR